MICLIMATMLEAKPFVMGMSLKKLEDKPFKIYGRDGLILALSGVGKTNAAVTTAYCCHKFHPRSVCNVGAAGAAGFLYGLGEIFHVYELIEYDRPAMETGLPQKQRPDTLKGFPTARLATQDRAIVSPDQRKEISAHADLVDMEGASIVQACRLLSTKCVLFKFVSDTPNHITGEEIVSNIRQYREPFYEFVLQSVLPLL